MDIANVTT